MGPEAIEAARYEPRRPRNLRCYRDASGRQCFNFPQRLWLRAGVPMACTRRSSLGLVTLAANVLLASLPGRGPRTAQRDVDTVIALARRFSEECLLGAPEEGWIIPRATVSAWLRSRACAAGAPQRRYACTTSSRSSVPLTRSRSRSRAGSQTWMRM